MMDSQIFKRILITLFTAFAALAGSNTTWAETPPADLGYAPNQVLVTFIPGTPALDKANIRASLGASLVESFWIVPGLELVASNVMTTEELMERLGRNPNVQMVEPNFIVTADALTNDPYSLWGMERIGAPAAWDTTTGSQDYVVAVIDTGVDYNHEDLTDNMWVNEAELLGVEGTDDDGNGYVDDIYGYDFAYDDSDPSDVDGHGTHVSGTICGRGNNGIGVVGVNWHCQIMALKFLDDSGSGWTANAILALQYALDKGVRVSNNSWGGGGYSSSLAAALDEAANLEHVFVAAAGNSNVNTDVTPHYPSSYSHDNVISVASTTSSDTRSSFSNYGLDSVDLGAPGSSILSTVPNNGYAYYSGTSMASPHVAGAAALLGAYHPDWTALQIRQAILDTVEPFPALDELTVTGGLLDVEAAIAYSPGNASPTADFTFTTEGLVASFTDTSTDDVGIASWSWNFGDGGTSTLTSPSHTYTDYGSYPVTLTVTDDEGASDNFSDTVTLSPPPPPPVELHVGDLDGSSIPGPRDRWTVQVDILVHDNDHEPVAGVDVSTNWTSGTRGGDTCTTDASGWCSISKGNLKADVASASLAVINLSNGSDSYAPGDNHDDDGDSDGTDITVLKDGPPPNLVPDAVDDSFTTSVDTPVSDNVLGNDNLGDEPTTVISSTSAANGEVVVNTNGDFTYTPNTGYGGTDSFTYTIEDVDGDSDTATVNIAVNETGGSMYVATLTGQGVPARRDRWEAQAEIYVESGGTALANVLVDGVWSDGAKGDDTCTTDANGWCSISKGNLKAEVASVTLTVVNLTLSGYTYDPSQHSVVISQP